MTLQKGDIVLIVSPAGRVANSHIDNTVNILENWGLEVELSPNAKSEHYNFSGTKEERLSDLQWALDHSSAKAIFAARGGYGAIQLLQDLDWTKFRKREKLLIGYSDICNLHAQINNLGIASLHGLMPNSFPKEKKHDNLSLSTLKDCLFNTSYQLKWNTPFIIEDKEIEGTIVGGNLSILYSLQGTKYAPIYKDKILFIEDLCEYKYHIDRIMHNFKYSGVFNEVKAVIVGDFSNIKDNEIPFGKSVEEIILEATSEAGIPVVFGLQTGHDSPTLALPLGRKGTLSIKDRHCTLHF